MAAAPAGNVSMIVVPRVIMQVSDFDNGLGCSLHTLPKPLLGEFRHVLGDEHLMANPTTASGADRLNGFTKVRFGKKVHGKELRMSNNGGKGEDDDLHSGDGTKKTTFTQQDRKDEENAQKMASKWRRGRSK